MTEPDGPKGPATQAAPAKSNRGRLRYNQAMRLVRRAHMYLGLFMTPWVFLYGVSAFFLNHPDVTERTVRLTPSAGSTGLPVFQPEALAATVVEALNMAEPAPADVPKDRPATFRLVEPDRAEFNRELMATVRTADGPQLARIDLEDGSTSLRALPVRPTPPSAFARPSVKLALQPFDPLLKSLPGYLKDRGVAAEGAGLRVAPDLTFLMEGKGDVWRVSYNAQTNVALARPASFENPPPAFSRYLILMHVAHTFPFRINARWVWAVFVDLMFLSMVGWGITGLAMWWQMKNVRRIGLIVLIASAVTATLVAVGMHAAFVAEGLS